MASGEIEALQRQVNTLTQSLNELLDALHRDERGLEHPHQHVDLEGTVFGLGAEDKAQLDPDAAAQLQALQDKINEELQTQSAESEALEGSATEDTTPEA